MTNPYANYFYLFNEAPGRRSLLYRASGLADNLNGVATSDPLEFDNVNILGGSLMDCPTAATISERASSFEGRLEEAKSSVVSQLYESTSNNGNITTKTTLDPSSNPGNKSILSIFGSPSYQYNTAYQDAYNFYYNFGGPNDGSMVRLRNGYQNKGWPANEDPAERYTKLEISGEVKDFKFAQKMKLRIEEMRFLGEKIDFSFEAHSAQSNVQSIKDFFNFYAANIAGQSYVVDVNTQFGVPYDYQTVISDDPEAKAAGVTTRQPRYHQIYNYYDAQYEPVAIDIIENELADEKALPSIYDFLYMPVQETVAAFLSLPGLENEEINLAGLNFYLDSYALTYEEYEKIPELSLEETFTVDTENQTVETNFLGNTTIPLPLATIVGGDEADNTSTKIKPSPHTVALSMLPGLVKNKQEMKKIKTIAYPQWINNLKTGVYFSEKSYDIFNQALDKDFAFPFFIKVDLPTENVGPITKVLKNNGLLDYLNSYVASKTIPATGDDSLFTNYYGGVVSGERIAMNNVVDNLKLNNIRLVLSPKPEQPELENISIESLPTGPTAEAVLAGGLLAGTENLEEVSTPYSDTNWYKAISPASLATTLDLIISQKLQESENINAMAKNIAVEKIKNNLGASWDAEAIKNAAVLSGIAKVEKDLIENLTKVENVPNFRQSELYLNADVTLLNEQFVETDPAAAREIIELLVVTEIQNYAPVKTAIEKLKSEGEAPDPYLPFILAPAGSATEEDNGDASGGASEGASGGFQIGLGAFNLSKKTDAETIAQGGTTSKVKKLIDATWKTLGLNWGELLDPVAPVDIYLDDLAENVFEGVFVYRDEGDENTLPSGDFGKLIKKLKIQNLKKELSQLLVKNEALLRGPGEIGDGELAHNETIMYEISKYRIGEDGAETYIQSIFLPITHQDKLSYYDTQVIPFQDYFYKIFAHKMVLGSRYRIKRTGTPGPDGDPFMADVESVGYAGTSATTPDNIIYYSKVNVNFEVEPYIQIIRVPYYNTEAINLSQDVINYTRIEDNPPLPPQINFVPFRNVNNKVLILLQNSIGEYEAYPRIIYPGADQEIFNKIYSSQDKEIGSKIFFRSDDTQGVFQVFRIENPPGDYVDFQNTPTADINELLSFGASKDTSFVDTIEPNKDYYYTCRFADIHGNISNPTDIYKIKIIDEIGAIPYITVQMMDLKEIQKNSYNELFSPVKKMKKYLYMKPNFIQTSIIPPEVDADIEGSYADYPVKMGSEFIGEGGTNPAVFGKKFKLRITSKQTGKKIDINLNVKEPQEFIINE